MYLQSDNDYSYTPMNAAQTVVTSAQWESALVVHGQIFEHSSNYFIIWKTTKMLIYQLNLNRLVICKKKHLNASVIKHSPPF